MSEVSKNEGSMKKEPVPTGETHAVPNPYSIPTADAEHSPRTTDENPKAADRAARQVATMFGLSVVMVVLFFIAFITIPVDSVIELPYLGKMSSMNAALGVTFGLAIFLIGAGAVHWAKKLMSDVEVAQERHEFKSSDEDTTGAVEVLDEGAEASVIKKYPMIRRTMLAAMALVPIPFIISLRDMWQTPPGVSGPSGILKETIWSDGVRIVSDITYRPIKADDIPVGGLVNAAPENLEEVEHEEENLNARAKAAIILVRMSPEEIQTQQNDDWDYEGILAFSKICTHVGCPISLYQRRTHELLCPCHQSTFDLSDSGNVVFGPAARRMPQLAIAVDDEGYLIAKGDFTDPVGPSFWELERN
jgi:ubiquinol-cytochrome c reductase iron-sulfur subunit